MYDSDNARRQVAYDLTMEFIRENKLLTANIEKMSTQIDFIDKAYKIFYDSLKGKDMLKLHL